MKKTNNSKKINRLILASTLVTCFLLFIISFFLSETADTITKIISITYLIFFILFLMFRETKPEVKIVQGKKQRTKNFTGSTYRKIFHRKECRFADSIKDEYFVEHDNKEFFKKQGYKACKLCMGKNAKTSDLKKKK